MMKNTAKYAWSFSRNSSFLRGLFYYAAPCNMAMACPLRPKSGRACAFRPYYRKPTI